MWYCCNRPACHVGGIAFIDSTTVVPAYRGAMGGVNFLVIQLYAGFLVLFVVAATGALTVIIKFTLC